MTVGTAIGRPQTVEKAPEIWCSNHTIVFVRYFTGVTQFFGTLKFGVKANFFLIYIYI